MSFSFCDLASVESRTNRFLASAEYQIKERIRTPTVMTQELLKEDGRNTWPSVAAVSVHRSSAYTDSLVERVLVHGLESGLGRSKCARDQVSTRSDGSASGMGEK